MKPQSGTGTYYLPKTVRASWTSFIIFVALGLLISFALLSLIGRGPSVVLPIIAILCVLWGLLVTFMVIVGSQRVVLSRETISYRTLISRHDLYYTDIRRVSIDRIVRTGGARGSRAARTFLQIDGRTLEQRLRINTQAFSKRSIAFIINTIAVQSPSVELDESAQQLLQVYFPR